ncbi:hypothetical protein L198_08313 [Cryptococcus wingfieldii CBS 7118]|uniref:Myb/SANT-like domain-containing protein n=1 Tax=Cryptococcus wingfieldii CBS 7118 TaxID=1295528 RepID=A0A1E3H9U3_9TREE|nr:hypothetical protein L198_08313 [Cryptococcus wingfieldii CBS 7118]ODN73083.1 hypothetical protein L198_08313 [Cryptococcus wingfieldii CBS 7118]
MSDSFQNNNFHNSMMPFAHSDFTQHQSPASPGTLSYGQLFEFNPRSPTPAASPYGQPFTLSSGTSNCASSSNPLKRQISSASLEPSTPVATGSRKKAKAGPVKEKPVGKKPKIKASAELDVDAIGSSRSNKRWSNEELQVLLEFLRDKKKESTSEGAFKSEVMTKATREVNDWRKTKDLDPRLKRAISETYSKLCTDFRLLVQLREGKGSSGWGWDHDKNIFDIAPPVKEEYLKSHPKHARPSAVEESTQENLSDIGSEQDEDAEGEEVERSSVLAPDSDDEGEQDSDDGEVIEVVPPAKQKRHSAVATPRKEAPSRASKLSGPEAMQQHGQNLQFGLDRLATSLMNDVDRASRNELSSLLEDVNSSQLFSPDSEDDIYEMLCSQPRVCDFVMALKPKDRRMRFLQNHLNKQRGGLSQLLE